MTFVLPTTQAIKDSQRLTQDLLDPLRPYIFGPKAGLHRYQTTSEKAGINLGAYDTAFDQSYAWPGRQSGSVIDLDYAKVWFETCWLNYFNDYIGTGSTIAPVANYPNRIASDSVKFKSFTNNLGTAYPRSAALLDRDVQVGDPVFVRGTVSSVTYTLNTSVSGFVNDTIAAVTDAATADAANATTQIESAAISQTTGTPANDIDAATDGSAYESAADGYLNRTYKIRVIQSSTGGVATTARVSVTDTTGGGDNQASVTPAAFGSATDIGTKGLTVTWSKAMDAGRQAAAVTAGIAADDLVVGQEWVVTVGEAFTAPTATSSGTYTGPTDTTYVVKVTRGGTVPAIDAPTVAPTTTGATAGGSLGNHTYYAKYTWVNANGESTPSPESSALVTSGGNHTIPLTIPALPTGVTSVNIYLTPPDGAVGTETLYKTGGTAGVNSLSAAYAAGGQTPPTTNTCYTTALIGSEPQVTVATTTGIDAAAATSVLAKGQYLNVGTYGVKIKFNQDVLSKGDVYYISAHAANLGAIHMLVLANDLPTGLLTATDLDLRLFINKSSTAVPALDAAGDIAWTADQDFLNLKAGIQLFDSTWTSSGIEQPLPVYKATLYGEYREWLVKDAAVGTIQRIKDVATAKKVLGTADPDNPVCFGVVQALSNTQNTINPNDPVNIAIGASWSEIDVGVLNGDPNDTTLQPWKDALTLVTGVEGIYYLVPMTNDSGVNALVAAHVSSQSDPTVGLPRACLLSPKVVSTTGIVTSATTGDGATALATLKQDPATVSTSYTYLRVPAGNAKFVTNGVAKGDIVRYLYGVDVLGEPTWTEFLVQDVVSEDTLRLSTGNSVAVTTAQKVEVWRNLSSDQVVNSILVQAARFNDSRVCLVWPDTVEIGGASVPGYFACAAIAGLTGNIASHQALSGVQILGIDSTLRSTNYLNQAQLDTLTNGGVMCLTTAADGTVYVKRGVTSSTGSLNDFEEMVRRNTDMFTIAVLNDAWAQFIGVTNINLRTNINLSIAFDSLVKKMTRVTSIDRLGPAVLSGTVINTVQQHPTLQDRFVAEATLVGPFPLNQVQLTIVS